MKRALVLLAITVGFVVAGCGSGPDPEAPAHNPAENGTAKGRLDVDTHDEVSK